MKSALLRPRAEADLIAETRHYAREAGRDVAERMFDAAVASLKRIERSPSIGSLRLGHLCEIPGLRAWRVRGFPLRWMYFEAEDHLDVVRLLGDRQDIVAILSADE